MKEKAAEIRQLFRRINKLFEKIVARDLAELGITVPQILVMKQIYHEPRTIGQISEAVHLSYSTVSGIIDRLERQGLVERQRDETDRRVIWIHNTGRVEQIRSQIPALRDEYFADLLKGLTEAEVDTVVRALQLLYKHLEEKDGGTK
ncbi:MarR family winged helix-turn-helix transcriptional regulator [Effusibacillus lacus]|uniref:Transcriptional regulator n=1 Tax=Effusibacillus lacus TaxID=1348429 RepID=A0A292YS89_9BACL|nr:MarR family transcriptional regulator [Effusibacillus lacus]TCS73753.1 DNA-binding MarR family transcriptional regulator [Effusibacillus lacus]GAX92036.1 transcriptional regulator [Effusibacillus lacus]